MTVLESNYDLLSFLNCANLSKLVFGTVDCYKVEICRSTVDLAFGGEFRKKYVLLVLDRCSNFLLQVLRRVEICGTLEVLSSCLDGAPKLVKRVRVFFAHRVEYLVQTPRALLSILHGCVDGLIEWNCLAGLLK